MTAGQKHFYCEFDGTKCSLAYCFVVSEIICNFVNNIKDFDIRHIDEMMTIDDIRALIASDESRTLELKKTTGELKDGMHAVGQNFRLRHFLTTEPATA